MNNNGYYSNNGKIFSMLAYIPLLCLIGFLVTPEKDDPGVRFHVGQGMVLSIAYFVLQFILNIISGIFRIFSFGIFSLTPVSNMLYLVLQLGLIVFIVIGIMNASNARQKPLPFIGNFSFYN